MTTSPVETGNLAVALRQFSAERGWDQFHTPKNLAIALSVEASELLEIFQWLTPEESALARSDAPRRSQIAEELADVLIYLVRMADILDIDLNHAVSTKLAANAEKYPADQVKGSAAKYTEYER